MPGSFVEMRIKNQMPLSRLRELHSWGARHAGRNNDYGNKDTRADRNIHDEGVSRRWFKRIVDRVSIAEPPVEIETDNITVEVPASATGVLSGILLKDGESVMGSYGASRASPQSTPATAAKDDASIDRSTPHLGNKKAFTRASVTR